MKKIRRISAISLLLCLLMLLASCGSAPAIKQVLNPKSYESKSFNSVHTVTVQGTLYDTVDDVALFVADNEGAMTYTVYNLAENDAAKAVLFTCTENALTEYEVALGASAPFFTVVKDDQSETDADETTLYDLTGKEIVKLQKQAYAREFADLIELDNVVYRVDRKGRIAEAAQLSALGSGMPIFTCTNGSYYYTQDTKSILVYNKKCELISNYSFPEYAVSPKMFVLDDGTVLAQYQYQLPSDAKDFSFADGDKKYDLVTLLINPQTGAERRIKADFQVLYATGRSVTSTYVNDNFDMLAPAVKNLCMIYPITNGKLITTDANLKCYSMSNIGKLGFNIEKAFANEKGEPDIATDKYCVFTNIEGKTFLANYRGKVIGEITAADERTEDYIVVDGKIYNYSLELLYDADAEKVEVIAALDHCVLLQDEEGAVKILTGTKAKDLSVTELIAKADAETKSFYGAGDDLFVLADGTEYVVYNDCGKKLFTAPSSGFRFETLKTFSILTIGEEASTTVYRLSDKEEKAK